MLILLKSYAFAASGKGKDLRPINSSEKTYLNLNKKKEDYSNLIKTMFLKDYSADNPDLSTMLCSKKA